MSISTYNLPIEVVERYDTEALITYLNSYLQEKNLELNENEIKRLREEAITGYTFLRLDNSLLKEFKSRLGLRVLLVELINILKEQSKFYHKIVYFPIIPNTYYLILYFSYRQTHPKKHIRVIVEQPGPTGK